MKTGKSMVAIAVAILFITFVASCGNAQKSGQEATHDEMGHMDHDHDHEADHDHSAMQSSTVSKEEAQNVLRAYLEVKEALVKTDGNQAKKAADELSKILEGSNDGLAKEIQANAKQIASTTDADRQRDRFDELSDNVYALIKVTEANEATLYRQYCPMAFNNKGAFWLSSEKEINNPYFGDKMLHCGSVKEEL